MTLCIPDGLRENPICISLANCGGDEVGLERISCAACKAIIRLLAQYLYAQPELYTCERTTVAAVSRVCRTAAEQIRALSFKSKEGN
jgi:hypothetical protein|eukprot:COSAG01_NODE_2904_length_6887_cov_2.857543_3_plen_87_part_00